MEIALLSKSGIRVKGKQAVFAFDPLDKNTYDATMVLEKPVSEVSKSEETIMITGAGEYEIGGVKITGFRSEADLLYSLNVDGIEILIGKLNSLDKMQHKLKDHHVVIVDCDDVGNASFITSLAEKVVMFYGVKAEEISAAFGKETVKKMNKYSSTKEKLPAEVETILLAN